MRCPSITLLTTLLVTTWLGVPFTANAQIEERAAFALTETRVTAVVHDDAARVEIEQTFVNPFSVAAEVVYELAIPDGATIESVGLPLSGHTIYARASAPGIFAAHGPLRVELDRVEETVYRETISHLPPGEVVRVSIRYRQTLAYRDGSYRFVFPTIASGRDSQLQSYERRPDRVTLAIDARFSDALGDVWSGTHALDVRRLPDTTHVELAGPAPPDGDVEVRFFTGSFMGSAAIDAPTPWTARDITILTDASPSMNGLPREHAARIAETVIANADPADTWVALDFSASAIPLQQRLQNVMAIDPTSDELDRQKLVVVLSNGAFRIDRRALPTESDAQLIVVGVGAAVQRRSLRGLAEATRGSFEVATPLNFDSSAELALRLLARAGIADTPKPPHPVRPWRPLIAIDPSRTATVDWIRIRQPQARPFGSAS